MDLRRPFADRAFAMLLLCYPASFRRRFGKDMSATFRSRLSEVDSLGPAAVRVFWVRTVRDAFMMGLGQRIRALGGHAWHAARRETRTEPKAHALATVLSDLRFAFRRLRKDPGLSTVAIIALALGIGVTAATFSITYATVLRGLPFEKADELVHFERENRDERINTLAVTPHDYVAWREQQTTFEDLGAYVEALIHLTSADGYTERLWGVYIDPGSFRLLRVQPALGRLFTSDESEPGSPNVIVLSHRVWSRRFDGDSSMVGRTLSINGGTATVIGVMPEGFGFPIAEQFWRPLRIDLRQTARGQGRLDVFGRLKSGVSLASARAEFETISTNLALTFPETNRNVFARLRTFNDEYVGDDFARLVYTMLAGSALVLLIACANVSNVLIARAVTRTKEVAVRTAIGASRSRIVKQFMLESFVLAGIGATLGIAIAAVGVSWFDAGAQAGVFNLPHGSDSLFWWDIRLSGASLIFVVAATGLTALIAGTVPAVHALRTPVADVLKDESRGSSSRRFSTFSRGLVVVEFALTTGLVLAAGLTVRSVLNLTHVREGFNAEGIMTARVALPMAQVGISEAEYPDHASRLHFADRLLDELEARPGVEAATITNVLPSQAGPVVALALEGRAYLDDSEYPEVRTGTVSDDYFAIFGVQPIEGRTINRSDVAGSEPVAVVNQSFATRHFPGESVLFQRIRLGADGSDPWVTIVGVVPDLWISNDAERDLSRVFVPLAQSGTPDPTVRLGRWGLRYMIVAVSGKGKSLPHAGAIRDAVAAVDANIPAYGARSMQQVLALRTGRYRLYGRYYLAFGIVALALAMIGLYGVMAFSVTQRKPEFGIRMALGAEAAHVVRGVLGQAFAQIGMGLLAGAVVAIWLIQGLREALFHVDLTDPLVLAGVPLVLVGTGLLASLVPAMRASRVDPTEAMRAE